MVKKYLILYTILNFAGNAGWISGHEVFSERNLYKLAHYR